MRRFLEFPKNFVQDLFGEALIDQADATGLICLRTGNLLPVQ